MFSYAIASLLKRVLKKEALWPGGRGVLLGCWGCAAGWGRIFTTAWIDYNRVAFSIHILEWGHTFSDFWGKKICVIGI